MGAVRLPGRRVLLRRAALLAAGAAAGAVTFAEATRYADRRLPLGDGPAGSTTGVGDQPPGDGGLRVVWTVRTDRRQVALTFDDGPAPQWTPMVLDILDRHRVPATFFLVGERVRASAGLIRGRLDQHEVANHSWAHRDLARMDADEAYHDLRRAHTAIAEATGREPRMLRPPWGHLGGGTLHAAARMRYDLVLWSLQMRETVYPGDPAGHARHIVAGVRPGTILLAHDTGTATRLVALRGLPDIIDGLRDRGFEFVTVSALLAGGPGTSPRLASPASDLPGSVPVRAVPAPGPCP
ncbi:polysaccharide deacetylase family protein [Micromonospora sp. CPCC 206060]|uniref:polysaccharide deacetylase family protein n=1 Tax=Micromonospora sp. CPCC 206060 TaxID=3122406 RepID=UPI002FF0BD0F